jgi:hypothetical protein
MVPSTFLLGLELADCPDDSMIAHRGNLASGNENRQFGLIELRVAELVHCSAPVALQLVTNGSR